VAQAVIGGEELDEEGVTAQHTGAVASRPAEIDAPPQRRLLGGLSQHLTQLGGELDGCREARLSVSRMSDVPPGPRAYLDLRRGQVFEDGGKDVLRQVMQA
jgi:hypothetical protein